MKWLFNLGEWLSETRRRMRLSAVRDRKRIAQIQSLRSQANWPQNIKAGYSGELLAQAQRILDEPTPAHIQLHWPWNAYIEKEV